MRAWNAPVGHHQGILTLLRVAMYLFLSGWPPSPHFSHLSLFFLPALFVIIHTPRLPACSLVLGSRLRFRYDGGADAAL